MDRLDATEAILANSSRASGGDAGGQESAAVQGGLGDLLQRGPITAASHSLPDNPRSRLLR
jgi:hypothetical protein